jgi:hypothetical protein
LRPGCATPLTRAELIATVQPIERALFRLGDRHVNHPSAPIRNLARALFVQNERFFTFAYHEGVASTNNGRYADLGITRTCCGGVASRDAIIRAARSSPTSSACCTPR